MPGMYVISVQTGRHGHGTLLSRTHQPRLRLPPAAAPACVAQGLISRVRGVFPRLPYLLLTTTTMSPARTKGKKEKRKSIRARDGDDGAALHCIRSTSCHPSPRHRVLSGAMQCEELSIYHINYHTRSPSRMMRGVMSNSSRRWAHTR